MIDKRKMGDIIKRMEVNFNFEKLSIYDFEEIFKIMGESFPIDEYRDKKGQLAIFSEPNFAVYGVRDKSKLVAFITVWEFKEFTYIEHFAVKNEYRNQNIGSQMLERVGELSKNLAVLEVEVPDCEISKRRVAFYERNGFFYNDYPYVQPSMADGKKEIPLKIMSSKRKISLEEFNNVRKILYQRVYKVLK
ncbi:MAG: GNAT family N-acetyltransferase [Clostridia bacterium]|nr:GNAT family N-acetyltransferase [Clostridia bacterium]